jgi:hypothetical protein
MNKSTTLAPATTKEAVEAYLASQPVFSGVLNEVRELSKKKPEATMNSGKVKLINRLLTDLLGFLKAEPAGKYLEVLDDQALPQMSDAVLAMVQFESALVAYHARYHKYVDGKRVWITQEYLGGLDKSGKPKK